MTVAKATNITDEQWRVAELLHGRPSEWVPKLRRGHMLPRHLGPLDDQLTRATRDGSVRALFSGSVRYGKSTLVEAGVVRYLATRPGEWVMLLGHSQDFIEAKSREIRDAAIRSGLKPRRDSLKLARWELQAGGGLIAAGVGAGGITGSGASLLVVDDVFSGREMAESQAERDRVHAWLLGTALTRLTPEGSAIVLGARWHLDDLHGRLAQTGEWEVANVPAITEDGRSAWPEMWPLEKLEAKRREIGAYDFAALYQGTPIVRGESLFGIPQTFTHAELQLAIQRGARVIVALDPASGVTHRHDHSAAAVIALSGSGPTTCGLLVDMLRVRLALPELVPRVVQLAREWGASLIAVEGVGGFRGYADAIRAIAPRGVRVHVPALKGDKWIRAQPLAAAVKDGRFRVPAERPAWLSALLSEMEVFPVGPSSPDMTDACSLGLNIFALAPPRHTRESLAAIRSRIARAF